MYRYLWIAFLLSPSLAGSQSVNAISTAQSFKQYIQGLSNDGSSFSAYNNTMTAFNPKEETEGSPYLFKTWVKGRVFMKNITFDEPAAVLNYDKIIGKLVMMVSDQKIMEVNMNDIQGFVLQDSSQLYSFSHLQAQPWKYFIEMEKGTSYSLYKTTSTRFYKADYVNKGLSESGYKYDRYVDENTYYIVDNNNKIFEIHNVQKDLRKLGIEVPVVKDYLKNNKKTGDNESYLRELTRFINQNF